MCTPTTESRSAFAFLVPRCVDSWGPFDPAFPLPGLCPGTELNGSLYTNLGGGEACLPGDCSFQKCTGGSLGDREALETGS